MTGELYRAGDEEGDSEGKIVACNDQISCRHTGAGGTAQLTP